MRIHGHHGRGRELALLTAPTAPATGASTASTAETPPLIVTTEPPVNTSVDGDTFEPIQPLPPEGATIEPTMEPTPASKQPGVIRNLLAGHYKGVAALRLAIVHHDRLQQALSGGATLPPPPDAKGHGAAYAKFRAQYDALYAPPAPPAGDGTTPIDGTTLPPDTTTPPADSAPVSNEPSNAAA